MLNKNNYFFYLFIQKNYLKLLLLYVKFHYHQINYLLKLIKNQQNHFKINRI